MLKVLDNVEYLDYEQAASEYALSIKSLPAMVSRGIFENKKFDGLTRKFISRDQLEAYKRRKDNVEDIETCTNDTKQATNEHTFNQELNQQTMLQGGKPNGTFGLTDLVVMIQTIRDGYIGIAQNVANSVAHEYTIALSPVTERLMVQLTSKDNDVNNALQEAMPFADQLFPLLRENQFDTELVDDLIEKSPIMPKELKKGLKSSLNVLAKELGIKSVKSGDLIAHAG